MSNLFSRKSPWSKRRVAIVAILLALVMFAACGDDSSSSSAESLKVGCKTETEDNCEYGELVDDRDGQSYKTVKIGDQWWMAQNLNFETVNTWCGGGSDTPEVEGDCSMYGRLYTWAVAKSVCPTGWHLPSKTEWETLIIAVGGRFREGEFLENEAFASEMLKSTSGWHYSKGTDAFSFSALPVACKNAGQLRWGDCRNDNDRAYFWSSTESEIINKAFTMHLYYSCGDYAYISHNYMSYAFSVRCLKDEL